MIKVIITTNTDQITRIQAQGHSGSAPCGEDLVCAGVSALLQALKIGLEELEGREVGSMQDGFLACPVSSDSQAQFLARVMELSLTEMARAYPKYLQIERGQG